MTRFYFIRHGEIPANVAGVLPGSDESLTEQGKSQALESARALQQVLHGVAHMYCSPMPRASETAMIIFQTLQASKIFEALITDDRLQETSFGDMVGMTWLAADTAFPRENVSQSYVDQSYDFASHQGGSFHELKDRVYSFIHDMKIKYPNGEVVVVTHGGVIRCVYKIEEDRIFEKVPSNASVHTFVL